MPLALVLVYLAVGVTAAAALASRVRGNRRVRLLGPPAPPDLGPVLYAERGLIAWHRLALVPGLTAAALAGVSAGAAVAGLAGLEWAAAAVAATVVVFAAFVAASPKPALEVHADGLRFTSGTDAGGAGFRRELPVLYPDILDLELVGDAGEAARQRAEARAGAPLRPAGRRGARMRLLGDFYSPGMGAALHVRLRAHRVPEVPLGYVPVGFGRSADTLSVYWSGPDILIGVRHPGQLAGALARARPDQPGLVLPG